MTPELPSLLPVYAAYVIAAGSPGPSNMQIMGAAMTRGRRAALTLSAGVVTGSLFRGLVAATAISAVPTRHAGALVLPEMFGGLCPVCLGIEAARAAPSSDPAV